MTTVRRCACIYTVNMGVIHHRLADTIYKLYITGRTIWSPSEGCRCEDFEGNDLDNKDLVFLGISPLVDAALCLHCIRGPSLQPGRYQKWAGLYQEKSVRRQLDRDDLVRSVPTTSPDIIICNVNVIL